MKTLQPLCDFFKAIEKDYRISITHIGIYAALLQYRTSKGDINPIEVYRYEIMWIAKITGPVTYHKCMRELNEYGYIRYEPSRNRKRRSKVYFILLEDCIAI
ncbi:MULTISPECIES: hypothetical protein [unclassified Flavobacterium]|uniref:hypothetical protein n=1 Tax=unclassified Flavobacterium TaxID=196869 RepID=UPI00057CF176|nr:MULTISPECIES: hypothetical protein [unclassified Flavobacterium]KIA95586.1 hypothetical protein OA93_17680 [Flavobacterium sp. KMS]OUL62616.1 hypothetical protein B8T70_09215 [Flavobacterium sp. AJR]